jgi:tetratricopeptide (TPR) repeat protein
MADHPAESFALHEMAWINVLRGEPALALPLVTRSIDILRAHGVDTSHDLHTYGEALAQLGRLDEALAILQEGLTEAVQNGQRFAEAGCLWSLGGVLGKLGRIDEARDHQVNAQEMYTNLGRPDAADIMNKLVAPVPEVNPPPLG